MREWSGAVRIAAETIVLNLLLTVIVGLHIAFLGALNGVWRASWWVTDWTSVSRRRQEQAAIFIHVLLMATSGALRHRMGEGLVLAALTGGVLWTQHAMPSEWRSLMLYSPLRSVILLAMTAVTMAGCLSTLRASTAPSSLVWVVGQMWYIAGLYLCCVPDDPEQRRRRRKLSMAKVKEIFGVSWMPEPEAVPQ